MEYRVINIYMSSTFLHPLFYMQLNPSFELNPFCAENVSSFNKIDFTTGEEMVTLM